MSAIGVYSHAGGETMKRAMAVWSVLLISAIGFFLVIPTTIRGFHILSSAGPIIPYWYLILSMAFLCEYVDSTLGMGYGTTLTPILLIMGFEPLQVVPCILLSELVTGVMAGFFHHEFGNVDFSRGSDHAKVALSLAICSIVGSLIAVIIAIRLPSWALKTYISLLVLTMGCVILMTLNKKYKFSWKRIFILGSVAAFNKGISGGGYGPVVTGGQILSGINGNNAVGITSLAEGLTCIVGLATYVIAGGGINWALAAPLALGGICSIPISAWSVSRIQTHKMKIYIGVATLILGALTLMKLCVR